MTATIMTLALLALTLYGLQRNHVRQGHPRVAGSVGFDDRDGARTRADLQAIATRSPRDRKTPPRTRSPQPHARSVPGAC
jgi:hypothetical protein